MADGIDEKAFFWFAIIYRDAIGEAGQIRLNSSYSWEWAQVLNETVTDLADPTTFIRALVIFTQIYL